MAGEAEAPKPEQVTEPPRVRVDRFDHSVDHLNVFQRAIKAVQKTLGQSSLTPRKGEISGRQYYSVDRSQIQPREDNTQPQTEPGKA